MTKRYRITNKCRFTIFMVIVMLIIANIVGFAFGSNSADSLTKVEYLDLQISSGDTLWTIAETYMPDSMDIREAVFQLCKLNDISADELYAGMTIQVPIYYEL